MRPIQRAAVTGLFALWLAPLGATVPAERGGVAASGGEGRVVAATAAQRQAEPKPEADRTD